MNQIENVARAIWTEQRNHWGRYRDLVPDLCEWGELTQSKQRELLREAKAAIAAMTVQSEPVAWKNYAEDGDWWLTDDREPADSCERSVPLYAHPPVPQWQGIESAPRDTNILVWFDHDADPYQDPQEPTKLTPYAAWAEGGEYLAGKGWCIAKWHPQHFEAEDEYGTGYWMPAALKARGV